MDATEPLLGYRWFDPTLYLAKPDDTRSTKDDTRSTEDAKAEAASCQTDETKLPSGPLENSQATT
jgi:hypothetical protein